MKLKRCPNMHYYDEDKYARCPHCGAGTAKPEELAPAPAPRPAPIPAPAPEPAQSETWRCSCGNVNSGKFCVECGQPKPSAEAAPEPPKPAAANADEWTCGCGNLNKGNFCFRCGARRPAAEPEPVKQEEPIQELRPESIPAPEPEPENDKSLTSVINEVSFTGNIQEVKEKAADNDDEGVTQIIFDELADELVLGWLVAANTEIKGKVFTVTDTNVTIGRSDPEHPVSIDLHGDRAISRGAQAVMIYDPLNKKFFIQSAGGKTPVYVNRQMLLAPSELSAYDKILLGATELVFVPLCNEKFSW